MHGSGGLERLRRHAADCSLRPNGLTHARVDSLGDPGAPVGYIRVRHNVRFNYKEPHACVSLTLLQESLFVRPLGSSRQKLFRLDL